MKTIRLMLSALAVVALTLVAQGLSKANAEEMGDPISIGFNAPLSGPVAGWGLPGLTGLKILADWHNAEGGILVGNTRHKLVIDQFDNEYVPSKALQGAKQLVFEHDSKMLLGVGGSTGDTQIPFLTENGVFYASLATTDINPNRPYVIAGEDAFPRGEIMRPFYIKSVYKGLKTYAVISQEDATAFVGQAWEVGAAKAAGWDVVYDKHFSPETTDFAPVVTAMLATNPDAVALGITWPDFIPLIMEQLYQQGFEGPINANYIEWEAVLQKVPAEWAAKVAGFDSYPTMDDPWWGNPSMQSKFVIDWQARFGDGAPEDVNAPMTGIDWLYMPIVQVYLHGVQKAGSLDPDKVIEAIRSEEAIMTIEGPATITGEDMWGIRNMMSHPIPTNQFDAACSCKRIVSMSRFEPVFNAYKEDILGEVSARGQLWNQRQ
ncbi:MAG: ABC transporter substrate-binding protein [Rhodospirillaceae bacterium]|nr:ABC transporter substrate-binding protein [Rhodospirillaceae bacterium]